MMGESVIAIIGVIFVIIWLSGGGAVLMAALARYVGARANLMDAQAEEARARARALKAGNRELDR